MRDQHKKNRWVWSDDRSCDEDDAKTDKKDGNEVTTTAGTSKSPETPISNNLYNVSTSTKYYLQRIYIQMGKNANMMNILLKGMIQPTFPKR